MSSVCAIAVQLCSRRGLEGRAAGRSHFSAILPADLQLHVFQGVGFVLRCDLFNHSAMRTAHLRKLRGIYATAPEPERREPRHFVFSA